MTRFGVVDRPEIVLLPLTLDAHIIEGRENIMMDDIQKRSGPPVTTFARG